MSDGFKKLKFKCLVAAIIKSAVVGISAGLFVAGVVVLSLVLSGNPIHWAFYFLIGVAVAAAAGGLCYLFMHPTDIKVAKKYDKEYNLNEKLQTMVVFAGQEGDMLTLQRESAAAALAAVPPRRLKFSQIWQYCVCFAVSVALLFSAVFIPAAAQEGITEEPPVEEKPVKDEDLFEYSLEMQAGVGGIINDLRDTSLDKTVKEAFVAVIDTLDAALLVIHSKDDAKAAIISAAKLMDGIVYASNTFEALSSEIEEFDEDIAFGMNAGILAFKSTNAPLTDMTRLKAFETRIGDLIDIVLEEKLLASSAKLKAWKEEKADEETGETIAKLGDVLPAYIDNLGSAMEKSGLDENNDIYAAFDTFNAALSKVNGRIQNHNEATLWGEIDAAYEALKLSLISALSGQCYTCAVDIFVRYNLCTVFREKTGIELGDFDELYKDLPVGNSSSKPGNGDDPDGENGDDPGNTSGGGNGKYEFVYGSTDIIYDPDSADYVSYGVLLDDYYAEMQNKIIAGEVPADLAKIIEAYFESLYSGIKANTAD